MRDYLKRVLELTKPYRFRLVLGLFCGFISGIMALTLPASVKLAVDTVFPAEATTITNGTSGAATTVGTNISPGVTNGAAVAVALQDPGAGLGPSKKSLPVMPRAFACCWSSH